MKTVIEEIEFDVITTVVALNCEAGAELLVFNGVVVGTRIAKPKPYAPRVAINPQNRDVGSAVSLITELFLGMPDDALLTTLEIGDKLGMPRDDRYAVHQAVVLLEKQGKIRRVGTQKNNIPRQWVRS